MKPMLKCPQCGTRFENERDRRFCDQDGTALVPDRESGDLGPSPNRGIPHRRQSLGIGLVLAGLLTAILLFFSPLNFTGEESSKISSGTRVSLSTTESDAQELTFADSPTTGPIPTCFGKKMPQLPVTGGDTASVMFDEVTSVAENITGTAAQVLRKKGDDRFDFAIGERIFSHMLKKAGGKQDNRLTQQANRLIRELQKNTVRKGGISYRARVIDAKSANAITLPGGLIVIYKPLLKKVGGEAELAYVLAHEIAHTELRHVDDVMRIPSAANEIASEALGDDAGAIADSLTTTAIGATRQLYDQKQEYAADRYGLCLGYLAGIPVEASFKSLENLSTQADRENDEAQRANPVPIRLVYDIIETHPPSTQRISYLKQITKHLLPRN